MTTGIEPTLTTDAIDDPNLIGSLRVQIRFQCVYLLDVNDNSLIVLEPEEAERLREWLAEHL